MVGRIQPIFDALFRARFFSVPSAERLPKEAGTDYGGGKQVIMGASGGIPLGRPNLQEQIPEVCGTHMPEIATYSRTKIMESRWNE
ncbi:hypothetical protein [Pseudomonas sp. NFACC37-1]|uniref:hypothetical protein n=1 Tax=Pseudomonas sp. NFACC37-1 TaxID=1566196 RepID=UPI000B84329E|nr:hypothetical protein [Pseudomonas sp. NFACC37-1]